MQRSVRNSGFIRSLARPLAMVAIWLAATTFFGLAYFVSGTRVRLDDAIIFAVAFAGAAAASAAIALLVGARRRWALEAALPMAILMTAPVSLAGAIVWLAPTLCGSLPTTEYFPYYRGNVPMAILGIARLTIPTGVLLGAGFGLVIGLSIVVVRHWPRLLRWTVAGLLLSCIAGSAHIGAFDRVVDFVVHTRLSGVNRFEVSWTIRLELAAAIGATAGAFVGAIVACAAVRLSDRSRARLRVRGQENVER
jgi:hypothetical protein